MNRSNKGYKLLSSLALAVCLLTTTVSQSYAWVAWGHSGYHHQGWGYHGGWVAPSPRVGVVIAPGPGYYHPYAVPGCVWVSGHWSHGYWIPAHRIC